MIKALVLLMAVTPLALYSKHSRVISLDAPSYGLGAGFFHNFLIVVGLLEFIENHPNCGLVVDFEDKGLYYEKKKGPNWWNYYFEPINLRSNVGKLKKLTDTNKACLGNHALYFMNRRKAHLLIEKYISLKKSLKKEIEAFEEKHFKGFHVIGVHYRGTDKQSEAPKLSIESLLNSIQITLDRRSCQKTKIFLATDDIEVKQILEKHFGNMLVVNNKFYSSGRMGAHYKYRGYEMGKYAVMDAYLLSKCHKLLRTSSNLSAAAAFINPSLPVKNLSAIFTHHLTTEEINSLNELNRME